jgi:hypothetical protein
MHGLGNLVANFWALRPEVKISLLQTLLLAIAGAWAFHLYRVRREGRSSIRLDGACRVVRREDHLLVFVRIHLSNAAAAVVRNLEATVCLLSVSADASKAGVRFRAVSQEDPLLMATSKLEQRDDSSVRFKSVPAQLEPKECVQTEIIFRAPHDATLLAARLSAAGSQGWLINRRVVTWGWFAFIDPLQPPHNDYVPLSIHSTE